MTLAHEEYQRGEALQASIDEARGIADRPLRQLTLALRFWRLAQMSPRDERLRMAHDLDDGSFSLRMIGKCVHLSVTTLSRHLPEKPRSGGRFEPEALGSMIWLRKQQLASQDLSKPQMRAAVEAGTSLSTVCRLTGIGNGWYERLRKEAA